MTVTWKYVKPLEESNSVRSFLNSQNICLPSDLIALIEQNNGGRPSKNEIITEKNKEYVFKSLLSYNKNDREIIYNCYPELFKNNLHLFPIGTDPAGNFICFNTKENEYCVLNHESAKEETIVKLPWKSN